MTLNIPLPHCLFLPLAGLPIYLLLILMFGGSASLETLLHLARKVLPLGRVTRLDVAILPIT